MQKEANDARRPAGGGAWYLVGQRTGHLFVIRIDRIQQVVVEAERFSRPDDFDLADFWRDWWTAYQSRCPEYGVRVRVSPALWPWLHQLLGEGRLVEAEQAEDGWREARLIFETLEEARSRLLSFGGAIEVLSPQALRASMADFGAQIQRVYRDGGLDREFLFD